MQASELQRAVAAARQIVTSLGVAVDETVVLHNSNKLAVRLLPGDVVARVAPASHHLGMDFEVELAQRLQAAGCPAAALDPRSEPRVHARDGFLVTLWTHYAAVSSEDPPPHAYAQALRRLHAGLRTVEMVTPYATDRVDSALTLVTNPELTPALDGPGRALLTDALQRLRPAVTDRGDEQLLHGEPHPGNLITTADGPVFVDLETFCRGPVEFDLAHAPDPVSEHYPGLDLELLDDCRTLKLAMITAWRWDSEDQFPDGHRLGTEWLDQLRTALARRPAGR